ncbi:MAG: ABC transporter ATP-binding protein [Clostridiaceae bacterium]|nr:ABC transporter ATP-binding protein [Clostridiaceae bacterium]
MLRLQNVSKYYYTDTSVTQALRKVTLQFQLGEFVAITGESGSGKSTLLNVLSGVDTFDEGEMFFRGEPTFYYDNSDWETYRREEISFVFQDYELIGHYTALDNVVSALMIMTEQMDDMQKHAMAYLEKVGLKDYADQKASELSSGQKQRLSIARALAKNAPVIVADEPTGNLDSETGNEIIQLLKELSQDKLILMVTHNYDQAEPYVTRKIRLHDGEIVADTPVNQKERETLAAQEGNVQQTEGENGQEGKKQQAEEENGQEGKKQQTKEEKKAIRKRYRRIAAVFASMNRKTQFGRALTFRAFFVFVALVSFLFIGQLYSHADDTATKEYDDSIFAHQDDTRLSVRHQDGAEITEEDLDEIKSVSNVVAADLYDYANDVNYYSEEGTDYKYTYSAYISQNADESLSEDDYAAPEFLKQDKFMKSDSCISEADLAEGNLPENRKEIVVGASSGSKMGDTIKIYFTSKAIFGAGEYYYNTFTVAGILKEETDQIYFYGDFCRMLTASADGDQATFEYSYDALQQTYAGSNVFIPVIGDGLEADADSGEQMRVSRNYIPPSMDDDTDSYGMGGQYGVENAVPGQNRFHLAVNLDRQNTPEALKELGSQDESQYEICTVSGEEYNNLSGVFMEVSETFFNKYYCRQQTQASVYITNYAKTDRVLKALGKKGFVAVSTYRISSVEYEDELVTERLTVIGISVGILLALFVVGILVLRAMMKIRIGDYRVLKLMGLQLPVIYRISLYEMLRYIAEAVLFSAAVMFILYCAGIPVVTDFFVYYDISAYLVFILYNAALGCLAVAGFNRLLEGRMIV